MPKSFKRHLDTGKRYIKKLLMTQRPLLPKMCPWLNPDYLKGFKIYTECSKRQLGVIITQNNRPIALFSRKLSASKQKFSVTKIELWTIVETL